MAALWRAGDLYKGIRPVAQSFKWTYALGEQCTLRPMVLESKNIVKLLVAAKFPEEPQK
jgi:hypothetical protein